MAIDTENTTWAVYQKSTKTVLFRNKKWPVADGGAIPDLDPDYVWMEQVVLEKPDYDENTQRLEQFEKTDLRTKKYQIGWNIIDLTQEEIDARFGANFETSLGIKLDISVDAQNAFTRMHAMITLAGMSNSDSVQIKDISDNLHTITVGELKTILKEYGAHCYSLFLS